MRESLSKRASRSFDRRNEYFGTGKEYYVHGYLAGYRAAKHRAYSPFCRYCAQPNTGKDKHTHEFCPECKRIKGAL